MALQAPPVPPDPGDCCGSGCARCVWDVYYDALEAFEFAQSPTRAASDAKLTSSTGRPASVEVVLLDPAESLLLSAENPQEFLRRRRLISAPVVQADRLTSAEASKEVIAIRIDLSGSGLYYAPGDALRVHRPNCSIVVQAVLARLGVPADQLLVVKPACAALGRRAPHFPDWIPERPMSAHHLFMHYLDLTSAPRTSLLRVLAEAAADQRDKDLVAAWLASSERLAALLSERPSLLVLLQQLPSCCPSLSQLLECLGQLKDRSYSVASAPLGWCSTVDLVISVEKEILPSGSTFLGHCSSWMARCLGPEPSLTHVSLGAPPSDRHLDFHLPPDHHLPLVLIASGTGLAPFRSFLLHRQYLAKQRGCQPFGPWTLFYGCRHPDRDFLFREELQRCLDAGVLAGLHVAFSRQDPRAYVHHLLAERTTAVRRLMDQDAVVLVCGSPQMVRDVEQTLSRLAGAEHVLQEWKAAGRLRVDVWRGSDLP